MIPFTDSLANYGLVMRKGDSTRMVEFRSLRALREILLTEFDPEETTIEGHRRDLLELIRAAGHAVEAIDAELIAA